MFDVKTVSNIEISVVESTFLNTLRLPSYLVFLSFSIWAAVLSTSLSSEVAENLTETDDAEFRQGGIAQQLMPSYPAMGMGSLYSGGAAGSTGGFQYAAMGSSGSGTGNGGYVNMIRNLYRPPSFGLTDKVRHWVKSFMNRRQYVKPYYNPSMGGLSYAPSEFGSKPMFAGANGYKAISVPLRQLQKYYKPYYATSEGGSAQFVQGGGAGAAPGSSAASSFVNYNPSGAGAVSGNSGLYASESASSGHFTGGSGGLYGSSPDGGSSPFGASFSAGSNPFSAGGAFGGSQGGSSSLFASSDGTSGGLFGSGPGSLYGASGSPSSGLYHGSSGGAYSVDGGSVYGGSDTGSSPFFGGNPGGSSYGSNAAAASSLLASLNGGGSSNSYGDLYASGANPAASLYNPSSGDNGRGYGGSSNPQKYGASSSALYMPSSEDRNTDTYSSKSSKELTNSFNIDSSRNNQAEASYSVSFQPAQSKSFSASSFNNAGFQPVSFGAESGSAPAFQEKSSS